MRLGPLILGAMTGAGLLSGCQSESAGPTASMLNVSLTTPNSDDGAILFTVSGGPVDSVEVAGYPVYSVRVDRNTIRVIVTGDLSAGMVARVRIADERQRSSYAATLEQVASRSTYGQRDPASYSLTLAP
jgi:hypothetical protein